MAPRVTKQGTMRRITHSQIQDSYRGGTDTIHDLDDLIAIIQENARYIQKVITKIDPKGQSTTPPPTMPLTIIQFLKKYFTARENEVFSGNFETDNGSKGTLYRFTIARCPVGALYDSSENPLYRQANVTFRLSYKRGNKKPQKKSTD